MKPFYSVLFAVLFIGCSHHPKHTAKKPVKRRKVEVKVEVVRQAAITESPAVNLPLDARARNRDGGSCVFVSIESCCQWQNQAEKAAQIRRECKGGSGQSRLHSNLKRLGVPYVFTSSGDLSFLEWAVRTRRGAMIFFFNNHAVSLVDLNEREAVLLDNNSVHRYKRIPRDEFITRWRGYGGAATTPLLAPPATPL